MEYNNNDHLISVKPRPVLSVHVLSVALCAPAPVIFTVTKLPVCGSARKSVPLHVGNDIFRNIYKVHTDIFTTLREERKERGGGGWEG